MLYISLFYYLYILYGQDLVPQPKGLKNLGPKSSIQ